jgi:hypothetical protein
MSMSPLLRLLNSTVTESSPVTLSVYLYVVPTGTDAGIGVVVGTVGNMVIGSRVVAQPEAVQPGHVGEGPIESQYSQQRSGQLGRTYWHIDAAEYENMLQNPKSTQDDLVSTTSLILLREATSCPSSIFCCSGSVLQTLS